MNTTEGGLGPTEALGRLQDLVLSDDALCRRLLGMPGVPEFSAAVAEIARGAALPLSAADIESALAAARARWNRRWV